MCGALQIVGVGKCIFRKLGHLWLRWDSGLLWEMALKGFAFHECIQD
jgi:hypothetical protein